MERRDSRYGGKLEDQKFDRDVHRFNWRGCFQLPTLVGTHAESWIAFWRLVTVPRPRYLSPRQELMNIMDATMLFDAILAARNTRDKRRISKHATGTRQQPGIFNRYERNHDDPSRLDLAPCSPCFNKRCSIINMLKPPMLCETTGPFVGLLIQDGNAEIAIICSTNGTTNSFSFSSLVSIFVQLLSSFLG